MDALYPTTNADGKPVIPMTDEQKYWFDIKGWVLLPALFSEDELKPIREHQMRFLYDRESLPPHERDNHGGASEVLLDHPAVVGVLNEIISHQPMASDDCYGFRYDHTYTSHRKAGHDNWGPHGGSGLFNFVGNCHTYQHQLGQVNAGLVRVVWELNEVQKGDSGTLLLSGSHKAAYPRPDSTNTDRNHPLYESYSCPPGSALIFTEALCHTGTQWVNPDRDRLCLFTCYNTVSSKWGKGNVAPEVIAAMKPMRQTLFRGVWTAFGEGERSNKHYSEANRAV